MARTGRVNLCECIWVGDGDVSVEPIDGNVMELSRDEGTGGDGAEDVVDWTFVVVVDQPNDLIEDLIRNLIKGRDGDGPRGGRRSEELLPLLLLILEGEERSSDLLGVEERQVGGRVEERVRIVLGRRCAEDRHVANKRGAGRHCAFKQAFQSQGATGTESDRKQAQTVVVSSVVGRGAGCGGCCEGKRRKWWFCSHVGGAFGA